MENQNDQETKRVNKNYIIAITGVILFAILAYSSLVWVIKEDKKEIREKSEKLSIEQNFNSVCSLKRNSLLKENEQLSIYKTLTKAMVHRDNATQGLKYKVGDVVIMKRDSSSVLIEDIIIGGSKYNYYVKYKVVHTDKTMEDVVPELIF